MSYFGRPAERNLLLNLRRKPIFAQNRLAPEAQIKLSGKMTATVRLVVRDNARTWTGDSGDKYSVCSLERNRQSEFPLAV